MGETEKAGPTNEQIMAWCRDLRLMADEADQAYGDPPKGHREAPIAALLNLAWSMVWDEQKARSVPGVHP